MDKDQKDKIYERYRKLTLDQLHVEDQRLVTKSLALTEKKSALVAQERDLDQTRDVIKGCMLPLILKAKGIELNKTYFCVPREGKPFYVKPFDCSYGWGSRNDVTVNVRELNTKGEVVKSRLLRLEHRYEFHPVSLPLPPKKSKKSS